MFKLENIKELAEKYCKTPANEDVCIICEDECGCSGDCGSNWMRS